MPVASPPRASTNPLRRMLDDVRTERAAALPLPPGDTSVSLRRTSRFTRRALEPLLESYERYGPIFTLRLLHQSNVFMLGPDANHFMLVSNADAFHWREGGFGELIPLLGDGLLTIDGDMHRRDRRIMLPAFHRERIAAALAAIDDEAERAVATLAPGARVDLNRWARELALRIALRALFGFDPDAGGDRRSALAPADAFEQALGYYGREPALRVLRGPGTPWQRMLRARRSLDALIYAEIARRRRSGERGEDVLSLLLDASDDAGEQLSDRQVRDEVMTLLFAGHDTTTSTIAFLFYELAHAEHERTALVAELDGALAGGRPPRFEDLVGGLPRLDMALEETLRLYPPAWVGPRRAVREFSFGGYRVPAGALVNYSSWASHRLPDVWEQPHAFRPERFSESERTRIPKGAYVPFGAGSRICLGMRFGQLEIKAIAARLLPALRFELVPGFQLRTSQTPTIGPRDGLPMIVRER